MTLSHVCLLQTQTLPLNFFFPLTVSTCIKFRERSKLNPRSSLFYKRGIRIPPQPFYTNTEMSTETTTTEPAPFNRDLKILSPPKNAGPIRTL